MRPTGQNELIGCDFGFRGIDFDAALEMGAVFDADSSATKVTGDRAVFRNFDATASLDIADNLATDNYFARMNFRMERQPRFETLKSAICVG